MMLQQYLIVFNEQVKILVGKLKKEADTGKMFDVWQYMANANIDIITGEEIVFVCFVIFRDWGWRRTWKYQAILVKWTGKQTSFRNTRIRTVIFVVTCMKYEPW